MIIPSDFLKWLNVFNIKPGGGGGGIITLAKGGTGADLTANDGAVFISGASVGYLSKTLPAGLDFAGALSMGGFGINNLADPVASTDAVTKQYADNIAGGLNPVIAVQAATTPGGGNLNTTYNNGSSGEGATLTNAGTLAAFVLDGYAFNNGDRALIKDQTTTLQNGVYVVTNQGSGSVAYVLTRAPDYDTPVNIKKGDLLSIENGSVNAGSSWYQTSNVIAVGTSPITWSVFYTPATYLQAAQNLVNVASVPLSRLNLSVPGTAAYAGNPNTNVAGQFGDFVVDTTDSNTLYLCTVTGNAASAVWAAQGGSSSPWTTGAGTGSAFGGDPSSTCAGDYSLVWGNNSAACASTYSFVLGYGAYTDNGSSSGNFAMGYQAIVHGTYSFAFGSSNTRVGSSGINAFAFGDNCTASNQSCFSFGTSCNTAHPYSVAWGNSANSNYTGSWCIGDSNASPNAPTAVDQFFATFAGGFNLHVGANLFLMDANGNFSANNILPGYTTTATAAATTTLTVSSSYLQFFTGTTTQTVLLPVTSTLALGQPFEVVNNSTGVVTVQSSGGNTIQAMAAGTTAIFNCILLSGTSAASWSVTYISAGGGGSAAGTTNDIQYNVSGSFAADTGHFTYDATNRNFKCFSGSTIINSSTDCIVMGYNAESKSSYAIVQGYEAAVYGTTGIAIGYQAFANANTTGAVVIGDGAGSENSSANTGSVVIGYNVINGGNYSVAIATGSSCNNANNGIQIGYLANAVFSGSCHITDGQALYSSVNTASNQFVLTYGGGFQLWSATGTMNASLTSAGSILQGVITNSNAASGYIGEYISSTVTQASPVTITSSAVAQDITSISLTAGDWDVWGSVGSVANGSTTTSYVIGWTSTTSATTPTYPNNGSMFSLDGVNLVGGHNVIMPTGTQRISIASTTTVYLSADIGFAVSTMAACGFIGARRVR